MKNKKATLADLEERIGNWAANYIEKHGLVALGKSFKLHVEVEHHKTSHLFITKGKTGKAFPRASDDPMTEEDWKIIFSLPCFNKPPADSMFERFLENLRTMHGTGKSVEMPYNHAMQISAIFGGNGLMYHAFRVSGSTSHYREKLKFMVFKRV